MEAHKIPSQDSDPVTFTFK